MSPRNRFIAAFTGAILDAIPSAAVEWRAERDGISARVSVYAEPGTKCVYWRVTNLWLDLARDIEPMAQGVAGNLATDLRKAIEKDAHT